MPLRLAALLRLATLRRSASHAGIAGRLLAVALLGACTSDSRTGNVVEPAATGSISLNLTPSSLTLAPGATGGLGLAVTRGGSFAGTVMLTASGLPAGVSLTFGSSTIASGAVSTSVNLTAAGSATSGTTEISIIGTGSGVTSPVAKLTLRIQ